MYQVQCVWIQSGNAISVDVSTIENARCVLGEILARAMTARASFAIVVNGTGYSAKLRYVV